MISLSIHLQLSGSPRVCYSGASSVGFSSVFLAAGFRGLPLLHLCLGSDAWVLNSVGATCWPILLKSTLILPILPGLFLEYIRSAVSGYTQARHKPVQSVLFQMGRDEV